MDKMNRRKFLGATLAASAVGMGRVAQAEVPMDASVSAGTRQREFYLMRRYHLQSGPQTKLVESYFADALLPALARMGMGPVGAFKVDVGPETPSFYAFIPGKSLEDLVMLDLKLAQDAAFLKAAGPFWNAPAVSPAYLRVESSLLAAFEGWPKVTLPANSAAKSHRIFQLRIYESPTEHAHTEKVHMFHDGEFELFKNAGFRPVFFGDTMVGPLMPNLTYMLAFDDQRQLEAQWETFRADPAWKKLSGLPRYGVEAIVSNTTNLILSPLACSQI